MTTISDAERARIEANVAAAKALVPEFLPTIKDFFQSGLIAGWRSIDYVGPHRDPSPRGLSLDQIMVGCFNPANIKEKSKWA